MFSWLIDPNEDGFRFWLQWLVDEKNWSASEVIGAMFESHKYQDLQREYLKQKDKEEL